MLTTLVLTGGELHAQPMDWRTSVLVRGTYTTTSKLFLHPDAPTVEGRSEYDSYSGVLGGGVEFRLHIPSQQFYISLSVEYNALLRDQKRLIAFTDSLRYLPVREGIRFMPAELGVFAYIPLGSEVVRLTMGGGLGIYYAARVLSVGPVETAIANTPIGYGIHIGIGLEYRVSPLVAVHAALRFRDPEVRCENSFDQPVLQVSGAQRTLAHEPLASKILVDGMNLSLGLLVRLQ